MLKPFIPNVVDHLDAVMKFLKRVAKWGYLWPTIGLSVAGGALFLFLLDEELARPVTYPGVVIGGARWNKRAVLLPHMIGNTMHLQPHTMPARWELTVATPVGRQQIAVTQYQWALAKKGQQLTVRGKLGYFTGWHYTGRFVTQREAAAAGTPNQ